MRNLAAQYDADMAHTEHVAELALSMWDALGSGDPVERELLWAAAMLHDIGVAIDYDDHHKHSRYLILNAGLPGFSPRETALIGQMARYHRKGSPTLGQFSALGRKGDDELLTRCAAVLRLAEQLERSRDQAVDRVEVERDQRARGAAPGGARGRRRSRAGPLRRSRTCSSRRSGASSRSARRRARLGRRDGHQLALADGLHDLLLGLLAAARRARRRRSRASSRSRPSRRRRRSGRRSRRPPPSRSARGRTTTGARGWPLPPHGHVLLWTSFALQTACMFLAEASRLAISPRVPRG